MKITLLLLLAFFGNGAFATAAPTTPPSQETPKTKSKRKKKRKPKLNPPPAPMPAPVRPPAPVRAPAPVRTPAPIRAPAPVPSARPEGERVELDTLNHSAPTTSPKETAPAATTPHIGFYFDLLFYNRPGIAGSGKNSFDTFHNRFLIDIAPTADIQFTAEVNPSPAYFELDYQVLPRLQLRLGRIWIPFDDMAPHNMYGGRVNTSRLVPPGNDPFLPDLWTDLGVGVKFQLVDQVNFTLESHAYVVNGFTSGGTDPLGETTQYPNFGSSQTGADANDDKAFGARLHSTLFKRLSVGLSGYRGRYTNDGVENRAVTMYGVDGQLALGSSNLRLGLIRMDVGLTSASSASSMSRSGGYVELGQKLGSAGRWKILGRAGYLNPDSRVNDRSDVRLVGGTLVFKPNLLEWSIEHSQDLFKNVPKSNTQFTALRLVMAF